VIAVSVGAHHYLARNLYARRTRTCCRTQHPLQPAALSFVSYEFVLVRVRVELLNRVSSAWSVAIALSSIPFILYCEFRSFEVAVGCIYSESQALEATWRQRRGRLGRTIFKPVILDRVGGGHENLRDCNAGDRCAIDLFPQAFSLLIGCTFWYFFGNFG
jgi:hypothetical protein